MLLDADVVAMDELNEHEHEIDTSMNLGLLPPPSSLLRRPPSAAGAASSPVSSL